MTHKPQTPDLTITAKSGIHTRTGYGKVIFIGVSEMKSGSAFKLKRNLSKLAQMIDLELLAETPHRREG
ncbi:hypothetical protein [Octadecabacter arcticus]|jgi:hypothetical protein|uniref:hypothetical protein n=1 Tax=Octadecabacter arcticus TaxID=53946 RepID=UPI0005C7268F|nr:hypothetical protein [Octadecabacter arcticus]